MLSRPCAAVTRLSWWRCRPPGWCPGCPAAPSPFYPRGPSLLPSWTWRRPRCRWRAPAGRRRPWRSRRGCWEPWWSRRWSRSRAASVCRAAWMMQRVAPRCPQHRHRCGLDSQWRRRELQVRMQMRVCACECVRPCVCACVCARVMTIESTMFLRELPSHGCCYVLLSHETPNLEL